MVVTWSASGLLFSCKPTLAGIKSQGSKVGQIISGILPTSMGQVIPGILQSRVGQSIPGIPGSDHFRNRWVRSFPESPGSDNSRNSHRVGQMISGIFSMAFKIKDRRRPDGYRDTLPGMKKPSQLYCLCFSVIQDFLNKKSLVLLQGFFIIKDRRRLTLPGIIQVPSALAGLTALFGMGRGDPRRHSHLKLFK